MASSTFQRQTVLVVEDDPDLRRIFHDTLRAGGYSVSDAADGLDALRIIENRIPDLIVLDLVLPALDGISVRDEIRARADTRAIPIIVVTGATLDGRLRDVCVLRKPVAPDVLLATVRRSLAGLAC